MLTNLLSNAIRFTDRGEVILRVVQVSEIMLRFEVTDTGIGISLPDQAHLFQAFNQADGSTTRKYGGTGLGLAIARQLVHLMQGEIGVTSQLGQGSTFWFTACFAPPSAGHDDAPADPELLVTDGSAAGERAAERQPANSQLAPNPSSPSAWSLRSTVRILLAEDNAINQKVAIRMLAKLGYHADTVADGKEVLEALQLIPYDIIFMDCHMPELDGYETTRRIRLTDARPIHIIAITANAMEGDRKKCLDAGMNDYIPKPLKASDIQAALGRWHLAESN